MNSTWTIALLVAAIAAVLAFSIWLGFRHARRLGEARGRRDVEIRQRRSADEARERMEKVEPGTSRDAVDDLRRGEF